MGLPLYLSPLISAQGSWDLRPLSSGLRQQQGEGVRRVAQFSSPTQDQASLSFPTIVASGGLFSLLLGPILRIKGHINPLAP